jgi:hypothetical protein
MPMPTCGCLKPDLGEYLVVRCAPVNAERGNAESQVITKDKKVRAVWLAHLPRK